MLTTIIAGIILLAFGIAFCFYGFRTFLILLPIIGFIAGFYIGAQAMQIALGEGFLATTLSIIVGLGSGVIGAFASYVLMIIGIILIAGIMGFAVTAGILNLFSIDNTCISSLIGLVSAIAAVWLTLRLSLVRYVLIFLTAILGADLIILSVLLFFNRITLDQITSPLGTISPILRDSPLYIVIFLVLLGAGIYVQYLASRDFDFENIKVFERWSAANR
ncbi:MAG: TM7S3/TM198-like domain-containing protein [Anaerolineales bacterium]